MKKIINIALLIFLFASCSHEEVMKYGDAKYIHFTENDTKEIRFSFATKPGIDNYELEIPVTLIGLALNESQEYTISIDTKETTASSSTFEIPTQVFSKGVYEDKIRLTLNKTAELSNEKKIVLKIVANDIFELGPMNFTTKTIYVSNIMSEPAWWADYEDAFFGVYSDAKYSEFIKATDISDLSEMSIEEITALMRDFIYYLRRLDDAGTPAYMEDGITKILDSINYTNA